MMPANAKKCTWRSFAHVAPVTKNNWRQMIVLIPPHVTFNGHLIAQVCDQLIF